jgi:hypothetical protein
MKTEKTIKKIKEEKDKKIFWKSSITINKVTRYKFPPIITIKLI